MKRKLNELDRTAIVAARVLGKSVVQIAADHGVSRQTIHNVLRMLKEAHDSDDMNAAAYVNRLKRKSIVAVEAGLKSRDEIVEEGGTADEYDRYKTANLGMKVLEGVGEFKNTSVNEHIHRFLSLPADWQARYGYVGQGIEPPEQVITIEAQDEDDD